MPREAASRAMPAPLMPPPMMTRSYASEAAIRLDGPATAAETSESARQPVRTRIRGQHHLALGDGDAATARDRRERADLLGFREESVDLVERPGALERAAHLGVVQDLGTVVLHELHDPGEGAGRQLELDDDQLALEVVAQRHVVDVDDVDQLGELGVELRDCGV